MHYDASWDAPPTSFIKPHAKYKHGGGSQGFVLKEYNGGMLGKGAWK
jgi:hypothetical protein